MNGQDSMRWGYRVMGHPEFGTEFHLVGSYASAVGKADSINWQRSDNVASPVHEDEFL